MIAAQQFLKDADKCAVVEDVLKSLKTVIPQLKKKLHYKQKTGIQILTSKSTEVQQNVLIIHSIFYYCINLQLF